MYYDGQPPGDDLVEDHLIGLVDGIDPDVEIIVNDVAGSGYQHCGGADEQEGEERHPGALIKRPDNAPPCNTLCKKDDDEILPPDEPEPRHGLVD